MEDEQEGIEIENIGSNSIIDKVNQYEGEQQEQEEGNQTDHEERDNEPVDDGNKESLKRGLNAERKQRKEAEKKNKELEARIKALEEMNKEKEKSTVEELIEGGIDEDVAKSIATAIDKKKTDTSKLENQVKELQFSNELMEKSREQGFEDILDYADEIKDLVDKGLTIEQSYYATTYDKPKSKNTQSEIQRKLEAKMQNNQARKEILGNVNSKAGASIHSNNTNAKVTKLEIAMAAAADMSVEEYIAFRDMKTTKDYEAYKSKKKK